MHSNRTSKTRLFYADDESFVQEPIFIAREKDAAEGDGWVILLVERMADMKCDLIVLDTREFEKPVTIVQLPLHIKE